MRSSLSRIDLPLGRLPEYGPFVRHVWSYEDPKIGRVITSPPFVFEAIFAPVSEGEALVKLARATLKMLEMDQKRLFVTTCKDNGAPALRVRFRDLQVLYVFIGCIAAQVEHNACLAAIGRAMMWTLGFRWV